MIKRFKKNYSGGYIVILNTLFFLTISFLIVVGIANPIIAHYRSSKSFVHSKNAFLLGNSAVEESLYRLKRGMNLAASDTITLADGSATISVADTYDGKTITVNADSESFKRNIRVKVAQSVGVSFSYGLQAGKGGFDMSGGAGVNGNVYSNGDVLGNGGPFITGSVTAANASDPTAHQSNGIDYPPFNSISFGGDSTPTVDIAQSFKVSTTAPVAKIKLYMKKSLDSWMNNITVRIVNDSNGKPGKTTIASATVSATQITTSYNDIYVLLTSTPSLTPGTVYWLVLDTSATTGLHYEIAASQDTYANGIAKIGSWAQSNGGIWGDTSPVDLDIYFELFVGGDPSTISGVNVGASGTGDAWAHEIKNSNIAGAIYCQEEMGNNKPCDTSRPDPAEQPFPISEGNIVEWKKQAEKGGIYTGNVSYTNTQIAYRGPEKIVGNLSVGSGAELDLTGTVYVTGNVTLSGGGIIKLSANYQGASGIIVTDGEVSVSGGGQFQGSGTPGSYILVVTTSTCPVGSCNGSAVEISGTTGSVVLNAQKGTIELSGGSAAKQLTAYKIVMVGGSTVSYETGLASIDFSGGPSGTWAIKEWEEF